MRVLGMISGTSHDGIDVAVVDLVADGDVLRMRLEHTASVPYEPDLRRRLASALPPAPVGFDVACELDTRIGQAFAGAARAAVDAAAGPVDLVCSHGQTVFHWVEGGHALGTLQLGQPAWVAEATGLPVVSDVRAADVAAGGHGAPLVPVLDRLLLGGLVGEGRRAGALNLGGIANVTVCAPGTEPRAWDTGPANALVDAVVAAATHGEQAYDDGGRLAASGTVHEGLLADLLAEPYYAQPPPKSTGKELFHRRVRRGGGRPRRCAARAARPRRHPRRAQCPHGRGLGARGGLDVLVASGGGVRNPVLLQRIAALVAPAEVTTTDTLGVPAGEKEAVAFALIGWATAHGLPGNVPSCTGASGPRVLGRVTPPPTGPWRPPEPLTRWPHLLETLEETP